MSSLKNQVNLIGRAGMSAEVKTIELKEGATAMVANISLATQQGFKKSNGDYENKTQWHSIVGWNKVADIMAKIEKGQEIAIKGELQYRNFDAKDGTKRYITEIIANEVLIFATNNK